MGKTTKRKNNAYVCDKKTASFYYACNRSFCIHFFYINEQKRENGMYFPPLF